VSGALVGVELAAAVWVGGTLVARAVAVRVGAILVALAVAARVLVGGMVVAVAAGRDVAAADGVGEAVLNGRVLVAEGEGLVTPCPTPTTVRGVVWVGRAIGLTVGTGLRLAVTCNVAVALGA
jgi:hypothetical protein